MPRAYSLESQSCDQLTFLFPREIIARLDDFVANIPVNLARPISSPVSKSQQLEILADILDHHVAPRLHKAPAHKICALTEFQESCLALLILEARRKAYSLLETQPDTPLGFQKDHRGMLSSLFLSTWLDLTQGGTVAVQWEQLD